MKKMLCMLLALVLIPLMAAAEDSDADMLSSRELTVWAESYITRARAAKPLNEPADSLTVQGYEFIYDFATLYADAPVMGADTAVHTIVLTSAEEIGPRSVNVDASLDEVLDAYYTENAALTGSYETAVLYAVDQLPEAALWGQVNRDGQRVQTIQYAAHEQLAAGGEGYGDTGIIYTMEENRVSAIRVYGLNGQITVDEVNDVMYSVMLSALADDYQQVPSSAYGAELTPFGAEDMLFCGLPLMTIQPEDVFAALGQPLSDEKMDNDEAGYIRVQRYAGYELIWLYGNDSAQGTLYMLAITADGVEGPRAVRIGDSFASVYSRFRSGDGEYQPDGSETLYGDEDSGDFGKAEYGYDASATLRYGFREGDKNVVLQMNFTVMELTEILLYMD